MARLVDPIEGNDQYQEAQQYLFSAQRSAGDSTDNISESALAIVIGLGMLNAMVEIARQLNLIAILTEDDTP